MKVIALMVCVCLLIALSFACRRQTPSKSTSSDARPSAGSAHARAGLARPSREARPPFHVEGNTIAHKLLIIDPTGQGHARQMLDEVAALSSGASATDLLADGPTRLRHLTLHLGELRGHALEWDIYAADGPPAFPDSELAYLGTAGILYLGGTDIVGDVDIMKAALAKIDDERHTEPSVLGHDVCLVFAARGPEIEQLGYPSVEAVDALTRLKALIREVLRASSGRGCGVAG